MPSGICCRCNISPVRASGQSSCRACHNAYQKAYYQRNPKQRYSASKAGKRRQQEIDHLLRSTKDRPCMDCGKSYPSYVMDFDHCRGKKLMDLSMARQKHWKIQRILDEIAKCDVVCSNCHRERTWSRMAGGVTGSTLDSDSGNVGSMPARPSNLKLDL